MTQIDMFAPAQRFSRTSRAAARSIEPALGRLQALVLAEIKLTGAHGATDDELQRAMRINPSTERPRRIELVRKKLVFDSGRERKTASGRNAVVWVAR